MGATSASAKSTSAITVAVWLFLSPFVMINHQNTHETDDEDKANTKRSPGRWTGVGITCSGYGSMTHDFRFITPIGGDMADFDRGLSKHVPAFLLII